MKKAPLLLATAATVLLFTSCGRNIAIIANQNLNSTQVRLSSNNFKVIDNVSGSAHVSYIFGIGDMTNKHLYENAYSQMMKKADLKGASRAVINPITEEHVWGIYPIYFQRTITVSGNVIEFTR